MQVSGANTNNTMAEGLRKIAAQLTDMKFEPDADVPFLIHLETEILGYLKNPTPQPGAAQNPGAPQLSGIPAGPPPGAGGPPVGPLGPGPISPPGGAPGAPGLGAGPAAINPDELRRVLQGGAQQ